MKRIEAIIRPFKLGQVKDALLGIDIAGMTVMEVKGFGRQKGQVGNYRGSKGGADFLPKMQVVVVVTDQHEEAVINAIVKVCKKDERIGSGKIFVSDVGRVIRIRTGEKWEDAV